MVVYFMHKIYPNLWSARFPFLTALVLTARLAIERVQEGALSIICAGLDYKEALNVTGVPTFISYNEGICNSTFTSILTDKEHRLNTLLPAVTNNPYSSREYRRPGALQFPRSVPIISEIHSLCPPF